MTPIAARIRAMPAPPGRPEILPPHQLAVCRNCLWYHSASGREYDYDGREGMCRRYPLVPLPHDITPGAMSRYQGGRTVVYADHWCGEFAEHPMGYVDVHAARVVSWDGIV